MARETEDRLRHCPTCGGEADQEALKLRNYIWLEDVLPGRISATDFDAVLEHHESGRMLILEFKPTKYIPTGQRLVFENELQHGRDVWFIIDADLADDKLTVGYAHLSETEMTVTWVPTNLAGLKRAIKTWWDVSYDI